MSDTNDPRAVVSRSEDLPVDTELVDLSDVREVDPDDVRAVEEADLPAELDEPVELDITTEAPEADAAEQHRLVPLDEDEYR